MVQCYVNQYNSAIDNHLIAVNSDEKNSITREQTLPIINTSTKLLCKKIWQGQPRQALRLKHRIYQIRNGIGLNETTVKRTMMNQKNFKKRSRILAHKIFFLIFFLEKESARFKSYTFWGLMATKKKGEKKIANEEEEIKELSSQNLVILFFALRFTALRNIEK